MGEAEGQALYDGDDGVGLARRGRRQARGERFVDVLSALHSIDPGRCRPGRLRPTRRLRGTPVARPGTGRGTHRSRTPSATRRGSAVARPARRPQSPRRALAGSSTVTTDRTTASSPERATSRRCSTRRSPHSATRSRTSPTRSTPGSSPATRRLRRRSADRASRFPGRDDLIARYADATGADLSNLDYYRAFNSFKTACILHGVYARYRAGQKSTEGVDIDGLFARIGLSLDAGQERSTAIGRS